MLLPRPLLLAPPLPSPLPPRSLLFLPGWGGILPALASRWRFLLFFCRAGVALGARPRLSVFWSFGLSLSLFGPSRRCLRCLSGLGRSGVAGWLPTFCVWGSMETPPELTPPFSSWVVLIVGRSGGPGCTCCLRASPLRSSSPVKFICLCSFSVTSVPVQRWRSLSVLRVGVPTLGAAAVQRSLARDVGRFTQEVGCLA